jgi:hypothetical protein
VGGRRQARAALPPGKTQYPMFMRLGGPQGRSGRVRKISPSSGIDSRYRPARSVSLYRLSYPGVHLFNSDESEPWKIYIYIYILGIRTYTNCIRQ